MKRSKLFAERDHPGMSALKDSMLLILNIIICLTAVARCGRHLIPSSCPIAKGVNTESESGNAANNIKGEGRGTCIWEVGKKNVLRSL